MSEPRHKWSLRSKILLGLLVLMLIAAGLVVIPWYQANARLYAKLAELKAQGLPTTTTEVNDYYRVPEGVRDTTNEWLTAISAVRVADLNTRGAGLPIVGTGPTPIPPPGSPWPEREASQALMASLSGAMASIRTAADAGGQVRFPVDFSAGLNALLTNTQDARSVARVLTLDAHLAAHDGDHARALEDVKGIFAISEAIRGEPTLISNLVRIAMFAVGCDAVEQLVPYCDWNDADLAALQAAIRRAEPNREMAHALAGERAISLSALEMMPLGPFQNTNALEMLELYGDAIAGFNEPWPTPLERQKGFGDRMRALASGGGLSRIRYMGVLMLAPAMEQAARAAARSEARRRCTILALAAQRHRLKHGRLPTSLGDIDPPLVGELDRTDPFDGKPLRARLVADAFVIYSVGENEKDDGGQLTGDKQKSPPDVGFALKP